MKADLFTKSILTLIAASLILLCIQNGLRPQVVAAQGPQRVMIVDRGNNPWLWCDLEI